MSTSFIGFNNRHLGNLRELIDEMGRYLASGGCKDFVEYKYVSGKLEGLVIAERLLLELIDLAEGS